MSAVEDKIKELLEASMQEATAPGKGGGKAEAMPKIDADADGKVDDTGAAVVAPDDKNGPAEVTKKVKKAAVPGGEANKGEQSIKPGATKVKEEDEADEDLEVVAEEEVEEEEVITEKKVVAKEEEDDDEDASDDDEDDDDDKEMNAMKEKLHAMVDKMKEMKHMKASYGYMKSSYAAKKEDVDMSDDVNALTEGGEFDEEFKAKAKVVFEAAVNSKVADKIVELEEHYETQIDEETAKIAEELTDKVDTYLSYVVEQWSKDNELAVERGLKSEITEDFIVSLKKVFEEHYVDVPEDKYDVVAEQQDKITELEQKLNEQIEANAETAKMVNEAKKQVAIEESAKDLTDTQKEKFASLVEGVEFSDEDTFAKELETLKESYFPKVAKPIEEDEVAVEDIQEEAVNLTGEMKDYVSAISRTLGK